MRHPGLVLAWEPIGGGHWQALVAYWVEPSGQLVQEWVPDSRIEKA